MRFLSLLRSRVAPVFRIHLQLAERQVWSHEVEGVGFFVRCDSGSIWLTDAEGADRILRPGDRWGSTRKGTVVVEALARSRLELQIAGVGPVRGVERRDEL
ncbi:DUF2917 domain-containing protein [Vulgatibacter sp.]|uniref:DUF2917 domain-containing protein n=1 Tax=Vulgatibacter sp. TaxID=1971226 RepID=UPI003566C816